MARATSKYTVKGTRGDDVIQVVDGGVMINNAFKAIAQTRIDAGLIIKGDAGNDDISGGLGEDVLDGGAGDDDFWDSVTTTFIGGRGIDTIHFTDASGVFINLQGSGAVNTGGHVYDPGNGYLEADPGDNILAGTLQGIENAIGTPGNDWLQGSASANVLRGGDGDDIVNAKTVVDDAVDRLFGDAGNDNLFAGGNNDELTGGSGLDTFCFEPRAWDGDWIVHDYTQADGDRVVLFPYDGEISWTTVMYNGVTSARASFGGDSITFVGVEDYGIINLVETTSWPPGL